MENKKDEKVTKILNNCRHATFLIEKRKVEKLNEEESYMLELHLENCDICQIFMNQSEIIDQLVKTTIEKAGASALDKDFKKQLQDKIKGKLKDQ